MKKRRYHGQSRKSRLLAVMLVMAMLLGMSTISVYAGELTGDISMEQVDVDVGEAGTQKDTTESTAQEKADKVQEEMEPSEDDQPETEPDRGCDGISPHDESPAKHCQESSAGAS